MYRVFGEEQLYDHPKQAEQRALALGHEGYIRVPWQRPGKPRVPGRWVRIKLRDYPCLYFPDGDAYTRTADSTVCRLASRSGCAPAFSHKTMRVTGAGSSTMKSSMEGTRNGVKPWPK